MKKAGKVIITMVITVGCLAVTAGALVLSNKIQPEVKLAVSANNGLQADYNTAVDRLNAVESQVGALVQETNSLKEELGLPLDTETVDAEETAETTEVTETADAAPAEETAENAEITDDVDKIGSLEVGTIIDSAEVTEDNLDDYFKIYEIVEGDSVADRIVGKTYETDDLPNLSYMKLIHYNYEGQIQVGELLFTSEMAEDYRTAFKKLFAAQYQIASMKLLEDFWRAPEYVETSEANDADTDANDANSTFCAYDGKYIYVNPVQNPYTTFDENDTPKTSHTNAEGYLDRNSGAEHMITADDYCYQVFKELGFYWGGSDDFYNENGIRDYRRFYKE